MISIQQKQQQRQQFQQQQQSEDELEEANNQVYRKNNKMTLTSQNSSPPNSPSLQMANQQQKLPSQSPPSSPQSSCNSSYGSASGQKIINNNLSCNSSNNNSITSLVPGGVVTTQNISTVIKPKSNSNSLQFVKIQTPELSKKAVEQIRIAEESNRSKEKIKEVEEEWQNNLLNWKSKRRQQFVHTVEREPDNLFESDNNNGRKIKTFAEMMEQRARSGNRLGFNLQRYMGSSDDGDEEDYISHQPEDNQRNEEDEREKVESRGEDYHEHENNETAASKQFDLDIPQHHANQVQNAPNLLGEKLPSMKYEQLQDDQNFEEPSARRDNISVVDSANNNQLNSTFKEDISISSPQIRTREFNVSTKLENIAPSDDESCSDEDDIDDEEHEEQKHLQRVAFEAKLKAFEKLTKPTAYAPALRPAPQLKQVQKPPPPSRPTRVTRVESGSRDPRRQNVFQVDANLGNDDMISAQTKFSEDQPTNNILYNQEVTVPSVPPLKQSVATNLKGEAMSQSSSNSSVATSSPELKSDNSIGESMTVQQTDQLANCVTNIDLNRQGSNAPLPVIPDSTQIIPNQIAKAVKPPPQQQQPRINSSHVGPLIYNNISNIPTAYNVSTTNNSAPVQDVMPSMKSNRSTNNANNNGKQYEQSRPPQPTHERKTIPPQSHPSLKDDKEKAPPLQVSGKKRCSSCKEELGRGAAAFVVESLSLVYHTNCFRCSVCHANLSNGFRGVDVRVHAGALHCQNCYSKDGLNYSRV